MKFGDFYIGMPVFFERNPDRVGVIVKYAGCHDGIYYMDVDLGEDVIEYPLDELISAKGNV